jgi:hypothetical protein
MMGIDDLSVDLIVMQYSDLMASKGGFTFGVFKELIKDLVMQFRRQEGKYYVLLSLQEAEHMRGIIHARKGKQLLKGEESTSAGGFGTTTTALWMMGDNEMTNLGNSKGFQRANSSQHSAMTNCFRFVNSDTHFDNNALTVLLRVLEGNTCDSREKWWTEVRSCRRRRQIALDGSVPVLTVFTTKNEYEFMEFKAVVGRVQAGLQERGMLIYDAFRAFNSSNSGYLTCSELYGGLDYLGIPFTTSQIHDLVRKIAIQTEVYQWIMCFFSFDPCFVGPGGVRGLQARIPSGYGGRPGDAWWGGTHLRCHSTEEYPGARGSAEGDKTPFTLDFFLIIYIFRLLLQMN